MKKAGFNPSALFAASEQGVWYDPSDMSTMYQDAAGTTPVYMPGQGQIDPPVGLLLDKRLGLARGPELVSNGDFATAAGWFNTSGSDWTFGTGAAVRTATASANGFQTSIPTHVAGRYYLVSFEVTAVTNAGTGISAYLGAATSSPVTSPGKYSFFILSDGTSPNHLRFYPRGVSNFFAGSIDNISIREVLGNHAYQTTTTSRPTLSARYNLLTHSERFDNAVWTKSNATVPGDFVTAPNGTLTAQKLVETATDNFHYVRAQAGTVGVQETLSIYAKAAGRSWLRIEFGAGLVAKFNLGAGTVGSITGSSSSSKITAVGGGWYHCSVTGVRGTNTNNTFIAVLSDSSGSYAGDGVSGVYIWGADLRPANDGVGLPPYQSVVDANTYDTAGFPPYLKFDGVDDFLQTASVDFSGTDKLFVSAALRKLSDAAAAVVAELSTSYGSNSGSFAVFAPSSSGYTTLTVGTRGATATVFVADYNASAPVTALLSVTSDIGGKVLLLRNNGAQKSITSNDPGATNYGNYPLYIGRRGGTSLTFNGRLYSLLIRGAATPDATIATVERYLNSKARIY